MCVLDHRGSSQPQGLCSQSYPLSPPSYQPLPFSGIISNNIQTCSGVVHSKKPSLISSSSLQLLCISLFAFMAKYFYLLTSYSLFNLTLQSGFCPTVHPNCSYQVPKVVLSNFHVAKSNAHLSIYILLYLLAAFDKFTTSSLKRSILFLDFQITLS